MLVEVKTHSASMRRKKWYFNIWSLSSLFLAFASPGVECQGKGRKGKRREMRVSLRLIYFRSVRFGHWAKLLSSREGIRLSATGNDGLSTTFNT